MHCREEIDDLMQEAFIVYHKVYSRYASVTDNPAWLMSLFREALRNRLTDLARKWGRRYAVEADEAILNDVAASDSSEPVDSVLELITAVEKAPQELRAALLVLLRCPDELLEMIHIAARKNPKRASHIMCYLTGQRTDEDLWTRARLYLTERLQ